MFYSVKAKYFYIYSQLLHLILINFKYLQYTKNCSDIGYLCQKKKKNDFVYYFTLKLKIIVEIRKIQNPIKSINKNNKNNFTFFLILFELYKENKLYIIKKVVLY